VAQVLICGQCVLYVFDLPIVIFSYSDYVRESTLAWLLFRTDKA